MSDTNINININAKNNSASALSGLQGQLGSISNAADGIGRGFRSAGREIGQIGSAMTLLGASISAPFVLAYNNAGKFSAAISDQQFKMKKQWDDISVSIGQSMVPIMQQLIDVIQKAIDAWNGVSQSVRDNIVQTTLLTGKYLLIGGIAIKSFGEVLRTMGDVFLLSSKIIKGVEGIVGAFGALGRVVPIIAGVSAPMWLIVGAAVALVAIVAKIPDGWKYVADAVEKVWDVVKTLFFETKALYDLIARNGQALSDLALANKAAVDLLTFQPGQHGALADGIQDISIKISGMIDQAKKGAESIGIFKNAMAGSSAGSSTTAFGGGGSNSFWGGFQMGMEQTKQKMYDFFSQGQKMATTFATSMTTTFSSFFNDAFNGQLKRAQDYFAEFGKSILKMFADMIAEMITRWILFGAITGGVGGSAMGGIMGAFGGKWHDGGGVPKFHTGGPIIAHDGLAVDEVPAILQTGEGVLSRKGMANLDKLNNGSGGGTQGGGININPTIVVQAWDAQDVLRNMQLIRNAVGQDLINNGQLRTLIKQYGN